MHTAISIILFWIDMNSSDEFQAFLIHEEEYIKNNLSIDNFKTVHNSYCGSCSNKQFEILQKINLLLINEWKEFRISKNSVDTVYGGPNLVVICGTYDDLLNL